MIGKTPKGFRHQIDVVFKTEALNLLFSSRLFGFLRQHDPIGDPLLPNLNHRSLLLKVRLAFYYKFDRKKLLAKLLSSLQ